MKSYIKYWQTLVAILIVSGLLSFPLAARAAGGVAYEQAPDHSGASGSDGVSMVTADDFQFSQPILIDNITWWGGYWAGYATPLDNFTIQLYADNGGQPGVVLQAFNVGNNASRTPTGAWAFPLEIEEFQYSFDLPTPFQAAANTRYWLSIANVPSSYSWFWEVSTSVIPPGVQRSFQGGPWESHSNIENYNVAFRLHTSEAIPLPEETPPLYEQAPGHHLGHLSDGRSWRVADQFQFNVLTRITKITWWGGYHYEFSRYNYHNVTDNFTIQLYADNGGQPGTLLQEFLVGNSATRLRTGDWLNPPFPRDDGDDFDGFHDYQYSFELPTPVLAIPHTRYWLVIMNRITDDLWDWEYSANSLYPGSLVSFDPGRWVSYNRDFAFQLHGGEVPSVNIDIRPGVFPNEINIEDFNTVPVAILSSPTFNAPSQVVKSYSLNFGPTGSEHSYSSCSTTPVDVNGDGLLDLVCRFKIQWAGFQLGDTVGILTGKIVGTGAPFMGADSVSPFIPPEVFP